MKKAKKLLSALSAIIVAVTGLVTISAGAVSADDSLDLPNDYQSALSFYESNGETAVTDSGNEAIIVIPCINLEQYKYVMESSNECTVNLTGTYYQNDKGFEVYKADLNGNNDIEITYEFCDLEKKRKGICRRRYPTEL